MDENLNELNSLGDMPDLPPGIDPSILDAEDYLSDLDKVEIKGAAVMTAVEAFPNHSNIMVELLKERNIDFLFPDNWYLLKDWIDFLNAVEERFSHIILFEMGKKVIETATFPPHIQTLRDVLEGLNIAFHMNHRSGRIGYYNLEELNEERRYAIVKCHHAYPSTYDKGILQGLANKFQPRESFMVNVSLEKKEGEPSKADGGASDYFKIKW